MSQTYPRASPTRFFLLIFLHPLKALPLRQIIRHAASRFCGLFLRRGAVGMPVRHIDGLICLKEVIVIRIPELRPAMADNGRQGRIEHNGDEAAGKAVVVEVQSRHRAAGLQHQRRVDEPRQYAAYRAEVAGNGASVVPNRPASWSAG